MLNTLKIAHNFYALISGVQMKKNEMGRVCGTHETRVVHRVLVERPEGKISLGRLRSRWADTI